MKITYERLNQIIEEEVVKFKRLNEQEDGLTYARKLEIIKDKVSKLTVDKESTIDQIISITGTAQWWINMS